jgi:hypothetical protein
LPGRLRLAILVFFALFAFALRTVPPREALDLSIEERAVNETCGHVPLYAIDEMRGLIPFTPPMKRASAPPQR